MTSWILYCRPRTERPPPETSSSTSSPPTDSTSFFLGFFVIVFVGFIALRPEPPASP